MTDDAQLDYENLDVYRLAIEFLRLSMQVTHAARVSFEVSSNAPRCRFL